MRINANIASMGLRKTTKYILIASESSRISESLCYKVTQRSKLLIYTAHLHQLPNSPTFAPSGKI
jgi:hypothetical protein